MSATQAPVLERPQSPSWRLIATLGTAGALAGLFIVLSYQWTLPSIERHRATALRVAIEEVLGQPARADTLYFHGGALVAALPGGADAKKTERVYRGFDADGRPTGYAISASEPGFADQIGLLFGYDPRTRTVLGMKVLATKETPGLGDKIEKPGFTTQFVGRIAPLIGLKAAPEPADRSGVAMVTGATISSRTVIKAINNAAERWQPVLERYERETP